VRVLSNIDLDIGQGETVAIVGESGVGKSTLLHLLGGLDRPTTGSVRVAGTDLGPLRDRDLARFRSESIGFVFQFHHLLPDFTALENVMMPCLIAGETPAVAKERATALLERVGLGERLVHRPEPTGNLDPDTGAGVERLLIELNREAGITCVVVTHSPRLAGAMDRTMRLTHGHLEAS
jgi:lipoprotein-releasing system ATP-binding protein